MKDPGNSYTRPYIRTVSGIYIPALAPQPKMFNVYDIACGLSKECRYGNQVERHYSVAQHSVVGSWMLRDLGYSRKDRLVFLLHDAPEAYIGDVTYDLKYKTDLFDRYKTLEDTWAEAICMAFGVPGPGKWDPVIKEIDKDLALAERKFLFGEDTVPKYRYKLKGPWSQEVARDRWTSEILLTFSSPE